MQQKSFYMVYAQGCNTPTYKHLTLESAEKEAQRLAKVLNKKTYVLCSVKSYKLIEIEERVCIPEEMKSYLPF